jgi:hypothetical protein
LKKRSLESPTVNFSVLLVGATYHFASMVSLHGTASEIFKRNKQLSAASILRQFWTALLVARCCLLRMRRVDSKTSKI